MCITKQGKGYEIARTIWPDSILSQPPKHIQPNQQHEEEEVLERKQVQVDTDSFSKPSHNTAFQSEVGSDAKNNSSRSVENEQEVCIGCIDRIYQHYLLTFHTNFILIFFVFTLNKAYYAYRK